MMIVIAHKENAARDEAVVFAQEEETSAKAPECAAIKANSENDLTKALPAAPPATTQCLKKLKKLDLACTSGTMRWRAILPSYVLLYLVTNLFRSLEIWCCINAMCSVYCALPLYMYARSYE